MRPSRVRGYEALGLAVMSAPAASDAVRVTAGAESGVTPLSHLIVAGVVSGLTVGILLATLNITSRKR